MYALTHSCNTHVNVSRSDITYSEYSILLCIIAVSANMISGLSKPAGASPANI